METLFVGLGVMGAEMVPHARRAAEPLWLYDLDRDSTDRLARATDSRGVDSLEDVPDSVEAVILMLPTSEVVESVLLEPSGLLERLNPGALVIDMGSSVPESTKRIAERARQRNIDYVDAPVSGGIAKAGVGKLTIMAGADTAEAFERALPLLRSMGETVIHVGTAGAGHAAKALNNLLGAINLAGAAEVLTVATKFGIDPRTMIEVLNASTGRNQATEYKYPTHILTGSYGARFDMDLMIKDISIAQDLARSLGIVTRISEQTLETARTARAHVGAGRDHTEVARFFELRYGISFSEEQAA